MIETDTINCLAARRALLSDPYRQHSDTSKHLLACEPCRQFFANIKALDKDIHTSQEVDIPIGLGDRILLAKGVQASRKQQQINHWLKSAVAGLMLIISSIAIYLHFDQPLQIEEIALAHVQNELNHLDDRNNVQLAQLNNILRAFNLKLQNTRNIINYAGTCQIHQSPGVHIVFQGDQAPITLLLLPDDNTQARRSIMSARFHGVILPLEKGSVALIADKTENLADFEKLIYQQLTMI